MSRMAAALQAEKPCTTVRRIGRRKTGDRAEDGLDILVPEQPQAEVEFVRVRERVRSARVSETGRTRRRLGRARRWAPSGPVPSRPHPSRRHLSRSRMTALARDGSWRSSYRRTLAGAFSDKVLGVARMVRQADAEAMAAARGGPGDVSEGLPPGRRPGRGRVDGSLGSPARPRVRHSALTARRVLRARSLRP